MRLVITTPVAVVADLEDICHVRAEDDTGAFGILQRHTNFLTALAISVVSWRNSAGAESHAAVRGGVLRVSNGDLVEIATREAVSGDDLRTLETEVVRGFLEDAESEKQARSTASKLELAAIRHIRDFLYPGEGAHRTAPLVTAAGSPNRRKAL